MNGSCVQDIRQQFGVKRRKTPTRSGVRPQMAQNFAPFGADGLAVTEASYECR